MSMTNRIVLVLAMSVFCLATVGCKKRQSHTRTWCKKCGLLRESINGRIETQSTPLHKFLSKFVGSHKHEFVSPEHHASYKSEKSMTAEKRYRQHLLERKYLELKSVSPKQLPAVAEAFKQDKKRMLKLMWQIMNPEAFTPVGALFLLNRPIPWPDRFKVLDAFFKQYQCQTDGQTTRCFLPQSGKAVLVFQITQTSISGGFPFHAWQPFGKAQDLKPSFGVTTQ